MLSESERIELKALQRRAYAPDGGALSDAETARMRALFAASRGDAGAGGGAPDPATPRELGIDADAAGASSSPASVTPAARRSGARRPLLIGGAVVAGLALLAGGWALGRTAPATTADAFSNLVAEARAMQTWDEGSFRVLSYVDGILNAGGTIDGGKQVCVAATGSGVQNSGCLAADAIEWLPLTGGNAVTTSDGTSVTWGLSSAWSGSELGPGMSGFTMDYASDPSMTIDPTLIEEFAGFSADLQRVNDAATWSGTPQLVGAFGPLRVWAGESPGDIEGCMVLMTDADLSATCFPSDALPADITEGVSQVTSDLASLRVILSATGNVASPYRVDVSPLN